MPQQPQDQASCFIPRSVVLSAGFSQTTRFTFREPWLLARGRANCESPCLAQQTRPVPSHIRSTSLPKRGRLFSLLQILPVPCPPLQKLLSYSLNFLFPEQRQVPTPGASSPSSLGMGGAKGGVLVQVQREQDMQRRGLTLFSFMSSIPAISQAVSGNMLQALPFVFKTISL